MMELKVDREGVFISSLNHRYNFAQARLEIGLTSKERLDGVRMDHEDFCFLVEIAKKALTTEEQIE